MVRRGKIGGGPFCARFLRVFRASALCPFGVLGFLGVPYLFSPFPFTCGFPLIYSIFSPLSPAVFSLLFSYTLTFFFFAFSFGDFLLYPQHSLTYVAQSATQLTFVGRSYLAGPPLLVCHLGCDTLDTIFLFVWFPMSGCGMQSKAQRGHVSLILALLGVPWGGAISLSPSTGTTFFPLRGSLT